MKYHSKIWTTFAIIKRSDTEQIRNQQQQQILTRIRKRWRNEPKNVIQQGDHFPYIKIASEIAARVLQRQGITVVHGPSTVCRKIRRTTQNRRKERIRSLAQYMDCDKHYVNQTGRNVHSNKWINYLQASTNRPYTRPPGPRSVEVQTERNWNCKLTNDEACKGF